MPIDEKNNLDKQSRAYAPDFITNNYQLEEDSVDLVLKPGKAAVEKAVGIFTGSSILSPHAKFQLESDQSIFAKKSHCRKKNDPVVEVLLQVFQKLNSPTFHALAQSLSGFNEALLMRKQTLQLPIADPLGFQDAQDFAEEVQGELGKAIAAHPNHTTISIRSEPGC